MKRLIIMVVCMVAMLAGCASLPQVVRERLDSIQCNRVICDSDTCELYWERAQIWVINHCRKKVQTVTNVLIQTYGASMNEFPCRTYLITKEPIGLGQYEIKIGIGCNNMFGCNPPTAEELRKAFKHYILTGEDVLKGLNTIFY